MSVSPLGGREGPSPRLCCALLWLHAGGWAWERLLERRGESLHTFIRHLLSVTIWLPGRELVGLSCHKAPDQDPRLSYNPQFCTCPFPLHVALYFCFLAFRFSEAFSLLLGADTPTELSL